MRKAATMVLSTAPGESADGNCGRSVAISQDRFVRQAAASA